MSGDWEKALLSKTEELLYHEIMEENENSDQESRLYLMLLYFTMQMKHQNKDNNNMIEKDLQTLLHEMKAFQDLQEKELRDLDSLAALDSE